LALAKIDVSHAGGNPGDEIHAQALEQGGHDEAAKAAITHQHVSAAQGGKELGRQTDLALEAIAGDTSQQGTAGDAEKGYHFHDGKTRPGVLRVGLGKGSLVLWGIGHTQR
jgi:hypothetical protein